MTLSIAHSAIILNVLMLCCVLFNFMLKFIMLSDVMLNVCMLSVVAPHVLLPFHHILILIIFS